MVLGTEISTINAIEISYITIGTRNKNVHYFRICTRNSFWLSLLFVVGSFEHVHHTVQCFTSKNCITYSDYGRYRQCNSSGTTREKKTFIYTHVNWEKKLKKHTNKQTCTRKRAKGKKTAANKKPKLDWMRAMRSYVRFLSSLEFSGVSYTSR